MKSYGDCLQHHLKEQAKKVLNKAGLPRTLFLQEKSTETVKNSA